MTEQKNIKSYIDISESDCESMSEDVSKTYAQAIMLDIQSPAEFVEEDADRLGFSGKVLIDRLKWGDVRISRGLAAIIVTISKGVPGELVMWAFTLNKMYNGLTLTASDIAVYFPIGFPIEEAREKIWDAQKDVNAPLGNAVDVKENWK
jgi:hypothetical protein